MHMTYNVAVRHLKQEISHSQLLSMPIQTHPLIESNNFASIAYKITAIFMRSFLRLNQPEGSECHWNHRESAQSRPKGRSVQYGFVRVD